MTKQVPLQSSDMAAAAGKALRLRLPPLLRQRVFGSAFLACLLAVLYWSVVASDRYVSEAHIIIQRTDSGGAQSKDFGALLGGAMDGSRGDQLLLRDYLLSVDLLNKLDAKLGLRAHYSDASHDVLSRMWSKDAPLERFQLYYRSRVSVELDETAGVLVIKAQAYDAQTAQAIARMMVAEGERTMNELVHRLAREQVDFVEKQVRESGERFRQARRDVIAYQNKKGLVSPQSTAENVAAAINRLEAQRTELQTRRNGLLGYLSPRAPGVVELDLQLKAIDTQLTEEQARLTSTGGAKLNATVEEFQRIEMAARFAEDVYKSTLAALERSRIEATRTLKKVSVLQSPTLAESPVEPRRLYHIFIFILVTLVLAGILHLLATIIRDHKD